MTELIIDGIQAVLPQSFTIQVKRENPLITKNGEYTYDVTLDLSNPVNAELYKHLNRLNSVAEVTTKRSAVLIADNRVYCNGTEVITGWTDKTVTIQIASGNSELNYIIGGDREIASLTDMPVTDLSDAKDWSWDKKYPDVDVCFAPVKDSSNGVIINRWGLSYTDDSYAKEQFEQSPHYAQPFLCAYIRELIKVMGYRLVSNFIEQTPYKSLFIAQVSHINKWCEMLPGWTVAAFIEQLEWLFNASFVVNDKMKTVSILPKNAYYAGKQSVHIRDVDDVYEAEVDEEPDIEDISQSNLSYKVEDCEFWRWRRLPDGVLKYAKKEVIPKSHISGLYVWFADPAHQVYDTIYTEEASGDMFVFKDLKDTSLGIGYNYRPVNRFADIKVSDTAPDYDLEIVPATLEHTPMPLRYKDVWPPYNLKETEANVAIPNVSTSMAKVDLSSTSIPDMIQNNTSDSGPSKSVINIAFYHGVAEYHWQTMIPGNFMFPVSYIDKFDDMDYLNLTLIDSLRLQQLKNIFYKDFYDIDFNHGVKIKSFDPNVYKTDNIFEIRNKRYICAEIEYTLDANGRKGAWTGTFYPIRISDTEADARWILTDGKWRDGGVWLDNGRWLDE